MLLSATLGVLSIGIIILGADLLTGSRRKTMLASPAPDELRRFLRTAPPMREPSDLKDMTAPTASGTATDHSPPSVPPPAPAEDPPAPDNFVFRRHAAREFAAMELSHKRFRPAREAPAPSPEPMDFSTIQNEVRAALGTPARPAMPHDHAATLTWTEPARLAVLTLTGDEVEAGLALLREHNIGTMIVSPGHPFRPPLADVELLCLPEGAAAAAPLAVKLRAKLARGEAVAFYTATGLSGPAALLAARLSGPRAG